MARGRYAKAKKRLKKVVRSYPGTPAARDAWERIQPNALLGWRDILRHGPAFNRVDVVIMGDGYPIDKQDSFDDSASDLPAILSRDRLFGEYFSYFNFIQANIISVEDGLDGYGRKSNTALGARVIEASTGDLVSVDLGAARRMLERMDEHDGVALVLVHGEFAGTSGRGIATLGDRDSEGLLHLFGHAFAGLEDESAGRYDFLEAPGSKVNVSREAVLERVPWAHWIEAGAPGIGAYEGALGTVRGVWKPRASGCRMEGSSEYCAVCREALLLRVYSLVDPVESASVISSSPAAPGVPLTGNEQHEFEVVVLHPETHALEVKWWVFAAGEGPAAREGADIRPRWRLTALDSIEARPAAETREKRGVHRFRLDPKRLEPGSYRVFCRVRDTTRLRGERFPWVLKDERDLLQSERTWLVEVQG